jgi:hypothetical protein
MDNDKTKSIKKQMSNATYVSHKKGKYITILTNYRFRVNKGTLHNIPAQLLITTNKTEEELKNQILVIQNIMFQDKLYKLLN